MHKLNLHAHTTFSDGRGTIRDMAKEYKRQGFPAAVITDHVYSTDYYSCMDYESFKESREEAKLVSQELDYPIIMGIELALDRMEEVVIIGTAAIEDLMALREYRLNTTGYGTITIGDLKKLRETYECWISLCHPQLAAMIDGSIPFLTFRGHEILDAYEQINCGQDFFKGRDVPAEFEGLIPVSNSDAHSINYIGLNYNFTTEPITTEEELFKYVKNNGEFKLFNGRLK